MSLLYIELVPKPERATFEEKVNDVAKQLRIDANWLMQVMLSESGIRPAVQNKKYPFKTDDGGVDYATGLIQFTPATAKLLGTSTKALKAMTRVDQMNFVLKYFKPYAGKIRSYFDLYLVTFFPAAIPFSSDDTYVFKAKNISAASIAKSNPAINLNGDNEITMAEFKSYVKRTIPRQYLSLVLSVEMAQ